MPINYEAAYPIVETPAAVDYDKSYASIDPVTQYLNEIGKMPLLSAEQEVDLFKRVEAGMYAAHVLLSDRENIITKYSDHLADLELIKHDGEAAHDHIFKANLKLVVSIAKRYRGRGVDMLDLIQEGNLGLNRAICKFDYTLGYKFSTYGTYWIKDFVKTTLAETSTNIRIPKHVGEQISAMSVVEKELFGATGARPTVSRIAAKMGVSEQEVKDLREYSDNTVSLEKPIGEDLTLGDLLPDNVNPSPAEALLSNELKNSVGGLLKLLNERQATIISMRYGLDGSRPKTCKEIATELGLTLRMTRELEARSIYQLRQHGNDTGIAKLLTG